MSSLSYSNFNTKYNNSSGGNFPTNTTQQIGSNDLREFAADISDTFLNLTDNAYNGARGLKKIATTLAGFKSIATVGIEDGSIAIWHEVPIAGGLFRICKLFTQTGVAANDQIILPDDYATSGKYWFVLFNSQRYYRASGLNNTIYSIADLKAIVTYGLDDMVAGTKIIFKQSSDDVLRVYELNAGTNTESSPTIILPNDYSASTNAKYWKLALTSSDISTAKVSVSSAEILAINTTPKQLIAAPGASKFIQLISANIRYNYNSVAYASADNIVINHSNSASAPLTNGIDISTFTNSVTKQISLSDSEWNDSLAINKGLYLYRSSGNPTTGNGTLDVYLAYRIVDL
jgi:hypothetical protein